MDSIFHRLARMLRFPPCVLREVVLFRPQLTSFSSSYSLTSTWGRIQRTRWHCSGFNCLEPFCGLSYLLSGTYFASTAQFVVTWSRTSWTRKGRQDVGSKETGCRTNCKPDPFSVLKTSEIMYLCIYLVSMYFVLCIPTYESILVNDRNGQIMTTPYPWKQE